MPTPLAAAAPALARLLDGLVDYAGLYPPAGLEMPQAVAAYAGYRRCSEAWALGRFVVGAGRLPELATAAAPHRTPADEPWPLSVLVGAEAEAGAARAFANANAARFAVVGLEARAATPAAAERLLGDGLDSGWPEPGAPRVFVEVPLGTNDAPADLEPMLAAIKGRGFCAKVRTGGLAAEAFPTPALLAGFLDACARGGVPFKATAGLHHPVRSAHPFTYAPDSARGTMHGFLNVFVAAALAEQGLGAAEVERVLLEERPDAFRFEGTGLAVGTHHLTADALSASRARFALSFGSCSFEEPLRDLRALGLL